MKIVSVRLPEETRDEYILKCLECGSTPSQMTRLLIQQYLKGHQLTPMPSKDI